MNRCIYAIVVVCAAVALVPLDAAVANAPTAQEAAPNHDRLRQAPEAGQRLLVARGKNTSRTRSRGR